MSNTSLSARAEWVQQIQTPAPPSHIQLGIAATGALHDRTTTSYIRTLFFFPSFIIKTRTSRLFRDTFDHWSDLFARSVSS